MYDVLIVGCGITGAAAAMELSKYDLKVGVLERENDVADGTTKANSAILHAGYDPEPGSLMAKLNVRGVALARELCEKLDVPYDPCGSFVLAFSEEDGRTLETLLARGKQNGVPDLQLLSGEQARALEPNLSEEVKGALYAPTGAICSPWEYALALAETAVKNGAELHLETAVTGLSPTENGWDVKTTRGTFQTRYVINAAGLAAQAIHEMAAPHTFTIHPARGEYYLLDKSEGTRVSHVIFQCPNENGKGVLVAPTVHGNLIVGPNAQPVAGDDTANTREGLDFVRQTALRSVPSIAFRDAIRNFAGVRAVADTGDFVIGFAAPRFLDLAGICSPGLSAAPAVAEYAVELLGEDGLSLTKKDDFICERHRTRVKSMTPEEKQALIAKNPAFGRVICRCETVTEGEILEALHAPIPPALGRRRQAARQRGHGPLPGRFLRAARCRDPGAGIPLLAARHRAGPRGHVDLSV